MRTIALSWEDWRAVIAAVREKCLPYMLEHADYLERHLEQHGPGEAMVRLSLTDDLFLRSSNWARVQLGIPLPAEARKGAVLLSPLPHTQIATAPTSIDCSRTGPGHGSRGAPFGEDRPAIRASVLYRQAM